MNRNFLFGLLVMQILPHFSDLREQDRTLLILEGSTMSTYLTCFNLGNSQKMDCGCLANIYYTERPNQSSDFVLTAKEFMPQVSTSAINVFPVPASNTIHIESRTKEAYIENFGLTNSFGQLVLEKKFINSLITYSLDVSSLPSGAYVYEIKTSTGIATGRVLISK